MDPELQTAMDRMVDLEKQLLDSTRKLKTVEQTDKEALVSQCMDLMVEQSKAISHVNAISVWKYSHPKGTMFPKN